MPLNAGLLLLGGGILLAGHGFLRAARARSSKPVPNRQQENYHHTPAFWEHVFGRRRVKRLTYRTDDHEQVL
jgi:hypothetical protein